MVNTLQTLATTLRPSPLMPVIFVGHGNPMNAIMDNDITREWSRVGKNIPDAQAIVVVSAHWQTHGTHVTDAPKQPIIYDFYGFPDELYKVTYNANGDPALAAELTKVLHSYEAQLDSQWGLDHGTWSVLKHLAPEPKIPVLQISLDFGQSLEQLTEMFATLRPLRKKGVVFIGSGNIVHNLRLVNWDDTRPFDWAVEFDQKSKDAILEHDIKRLAKPAIMSKAAPLAVPTDEHYRPMLAVMSLLEQTENIEFFNDVIDMGSISMRGFVGA